MNAQSPTRKSFSVGSRLLLPTLASVSVLIAVQAWFTVRHDRKVDAQHEQDRLLHEYRDYVENLQTLERVAATLSSSLSDRPDVVALLASRDRKHMLEMLLPVFERMREQFHVAQLNIHEVTGSVFLRLERPDAYGDRFVSYRRTILDAIATRDTVSGVELGISHLSIRGVSPVFRASELLGFVEVGLNYDRAFLEELQQLRDTDYCLWITYEAAAQAGLWPDDPGPTPHPELFHHASTRARSWTVPESVYEQVLNSGEPALRFVSGGGEELALLIAPVNGYGDRVVGVIEVVRSRAEALAALERKNTITVGVAALVALLALLVLALEIRRIVLQPLARLTSVTRRQLEGDRDARVEGLSNDEYGQLGHAFNALSDALQDASAAQQSTIDELQAAQRLLRDSESRLQSILDNTTSLVYVKARDGKYITINRRFESLFHVDRADAIGNTDDDLFPHEFAARFRANDQQVLNARVALEFEEQVPQDDGLHTYISVKFPLQSEDGEPYAVCGISTDITQRKRTEEALRTSEANLAVAQRIARIGSWDLNLESGQLHWSEEMYRIHGRDIHREAAPAEFAWDPVHPDDEERVRRTYERAVERGEPYDIEYRLILPDGDVRVINSIARTLRDDEGTVLRIYGTAQDITERKRAEEDKKRLEAQLRQAQKMEAVGQLAGGVAHDFNNILTAILGNVELTFDRLKKRLGPDDPLLRGVADIEQAAQRASTLTRQLLAFSRRQVSKPTVLDLNRTLIEMEKMLRRLLTEHIDLSTELAADLRPVEGDAGQIEQVVMNLVVNARDAMPSGGRISLKTSNVTLDAAYCGVHAEVNPGDYVLLAVTDTGCGMDAQTVERVFEPFFTTKALGKGTGLGLSMVYGIVKQASGHASVYSESGLGTTFKIYWPAAEAAIPPSTDPQLGEGLETGTETVLVCEDDEAVRNLAVQIMQAAGYSVVSASHGSEALRLAAAHDGKIQLLLTDVIMPDMNGRQVYDTLKESLPHLRALFISGYTSDVIAHHGVLDEGVEFLQKPFTRRNLLHRVRQVLDGKGISNA